MVAPDARVSTLLCELMYVYLASAASPQPSVLTVCCNPWKSPTLDGSPSRWILSWICLSRHPDTMQSWFLVDKLTKYVHLVPTVTTCSAEVVSKLFLQHIYQYHG